MNEQVLAIRVDEDEQMDTSQPRTTTKQREYMPSFPFYQRRQKWIERKRIKVITTRNGA